MARPEAGPYKAGDVPEHGPLALHTFVILPSDDNPMHDDARAVLLEWEENGLGRVSTVRCTAEKSEQAIDLQVLRASDVKALYRLCHEEHVVIFAFAPARVQLDVSEKPSRAGSVPIQEFVRYKARFERPADAAALRAVLKELSGDDVDCDGPKDPRCLPFTIFESKGSFDLGIAKKRKDFVQTHKTKRRDGASALTDNGKREWSVGPHHSIEFAHVAGRVLPFGFHWDVKARGNWTILNGWERWTLPGTKYINVHPNGHIRGDNGTRTHAPKDVEDGLALRTPAHRRSQK